MSGPQVSLHEAPSELTKLVNFDSLVQADLYMTLATVFGSFEFELFETDDSDVEMAHAYLVPYPRWGSKGF